MVSVYNGIVLKVNVASFLTTLAKILEIKYFGLSVEVDGQRRNVELKRTLKKQV